MRLRTFGGLWIEELSAAGAAPRPRPLALLAILAVAGPKGVSRDRLLGVLWPDAETERARHALSQTIYSLRKDLGAEVVQATPDLRLDESLISSDVAELRAALRAKDWRTAAALYVGPFLEGFYLADAPEFERWVETERSGLATDAMRAIESLGRECAAAGQVDDAAEFYRRLTRLDPMNSRFAIAYMEALNSAGDRTGALAHGKAYGELVQRELDVEPDAEVQRVIARLREVERVRPAPRKLEAPPAPMPTPARAAEAWPAPAAASPPPATAESPPVVATAGPPRLTRRRVVIAVAAAAAIATSIALSHRSSPRPAGALPVIAVGRIRDLGSPDSAAIGGVLSEMLATSLGRLNDLEIIANSRMLELTPRNADTLRSAVSDAARRAGATELIEGELIPLNDRRLRLDIRRIDIARGVVLGGYQLSGTDRIALFDSAAALIAGDFRLDAPTRSLAEVSTRSPIAYRLYEEGLRAFYQYDAFSANRLFRSAVREDSSFAMAMYYAWRAAVTTNDSDQTTLAAAAMTLASRASEHDGLLIRTHVGVANNDPRAVAAAETLATRYPRDPEALIRAAEVAPDLAQAVGLLNRSIALDSAASARSAAVCRLCDALSMLAFRYSWADSLEAAVRTLERWTVLRPNDALPWASMSDLDISLRRRGSADAAERRATALGGVTGDLAIRNLVWNLRSDDLDAADAACAAGLAVASGEKFAELRWYCTIALRMEGRYREALALVREGRVPRSTLVRRGAGDDAYSAAILDFEMGRPLVAADEFRALANLGSDSLRVPPGTRARTLAWALTLTATAAAAGGDTLRARGLVDSIQTIGAGSIFPRDPLLHRFVRGLLFAREDQHEAAAQELRGSIASPTNGYTRANFELGRELLVLHRPAEGIPMVRAALRGGIEGSGLYVTRTEMHELLARLFDAAGQRDSAAAHYAIVERSWRTADPFIAPRRDAAKQWLARAGR